MDNQPNPPPNQHKPMGRGMMIIGWVIALGLLALVFGEWERDQYNPNRELAAREAGGVREVVLESNRQHHYIAPGEINGEAVTFILDTGATDVVVPEGLAEQVGLEKGPAGYAATANGTVTVYSTVIDRLKLGPIQLRNVRASINPAMGGDGILLGMSALRHVEMNQKDGTLTLRQPAP